MPAAMSARPLDEWANTRTQTFDIAALKGSAIGIHATHYLDLHLNQYVTKEPLLIALGGFPFALQANITRELQALKAAEVTPIFVFDGLDAGKPYPDFSAQTENAKALQQAWDYYDQQQADQVVDAFSGAGSAHPESLYKFLQRILQSEGINFIVAPYAASAQLAYLEKDPHRFIDAVFGPAELFFFDVEKIITKMDTELRHFSWVTKSLCQEEFGRLSNEQFLDLGLLLGSPFLPTFPPFETPGYPGKRVNIREALGMFNSGGRNALTLCSQFEEDQRIHELDYADRFKRAFMTITHHVIMDVDGKVGPLDPENASSDLHELIGQRLPEELYFYISKGIMGSRVPNWLTSGELLLSLPLGAEDTPIYRRLLTEKLPPIRTQALCLLSNSLHRFYQTKVINVRAWYDDKTDKSIHLKDLPSVKDTISSWRIGGKQLPESVQKLQDNSPLLTFCLSALKEQSFVSKSFSPKDAAALTSKQEIVSNVTWRFLQLRGYVDTKHQLTSWGKALESALSSLNPSDNLEEPTFLAIELIRLGILNAKDWFPNISGGPMRGSDEEQQHNLLISRVACFGKIQHKPIGYSGPLSRQLLSFRSLVSTVRATLRDLIEVILATLLLSGEASRDREDWAELGLSLPFIDDNDCGLAIAVRTYLDDLPQEPEPTPQIVRDEVKAKGKEWFQHSHSFSENLDTAFHLWDAVYKATQTAAKEPMVDSKLWDDTNKWLSARR
ncbi:XPG I-region protein [Arthroderma uncinatum]|uniref:XPG I-region protein n=1 Tax=Arthroderma uncinatum TaxID=74035 RepID=UPI00144AD281|nr:XPG I-region protein [Arthroderma uncinatum]KAF3483463.1 XPG I-region protein [Arthroderma uncinatum]